MTGYHVGDCRELLAKLPDESIHCCVTSPPYWGLRDYGVSGQLGLEATPEGYVANMVDVFREVRRVLRGDGTCWVNLGDSYASGGTGGYSDKSTLAGFTNPETKGRVMNGAPIARKAPDGLKPKDLVGIPWRVAFALQADGWYLRSDIIWAKPNPMPESVTDRPTKAHEYIFLLSKSATYAYDAEAIKEPAQHREWQPGRENAITAYPGTPNRYSNGASGYPTPESGRNRRSVWTIATEPTPDAHFATFPRKLVEPCILAGCPLGGTVLDPFGGSGTVGRVAEDLGRKWLLFDLNPKYAAIAKRKTAQTGLLGRIEPAQPKARTLRITDDQGNDLEVGHLP